MMQYYRFHLQDFEDTFAWDEALAPGHFAMTESDGSTWYYFNLALQEEAVALQHKYGFEAFETVEMNDYVDWGVQWSTHSPDFKDYSLQIDLSKYTTVKRQLPMLTLNAGPGFGDLSHPTTRLTLAMMAEHVQNRYVIDVGCGSGILSLAAILLGAQLAHGIDIEQEALQHAVDNAILNQLQHNVSFVLPEQFSLQPNERPLILMNMITSQQREAWRSLPQLHGLSLDIFSSGVLVEEKQSYLEECHKRGWELLEAKQEGDWMAFRWAVQSLRMPQVLDLQCV